MTFRSASLLFCDTQILGHVRFRSMAFWGSSVFFFFPLGFSNTGNWRIWGSIHCEKGKETTVNGACDSFDPHSSSSMSLFFFFSDRVLAYNVQFYMVSRDDGDGS